MLFGGGAGGGKTRLGCTWIVTNCFLYPGTRWVIGREELKSLKQSTLLTLFEVLNSWGLTAGKDYIYHSIDGTVTFTQTDSVIFLRELRKIPSDPNFDRLGSTEYTGGFIDEASEVDEKAVNVLRSRLRYKLKEYDLEPKLFLSCNPSKGYLYTKFYKPWREGVLPERLAFIQSLASDNHYLPESYIEELRTLDKASQERLLYGNWEYDDDPSAMIEYDAITDLFTNTVPESKDMYLIADIARFGQDKTVLMVWRGWRVIRTVIITKSGLNVVVDRIKALSEQYGVPRSHVLIDEDGIGGGVLDYLPGAKGFIANSRAMKGENYRNLKVQCYYYLARKVNERGIAIDEERSDVRGWITEELEQVKTKDADKDGKLDIQPKDKVKDLLGRSPDFSDTLAMRFYFELRPKPRLTVV